MDPISKKKKRISRIKQGLRKRIRGTHERPRLTVYRSNTSIYAQIINDETGETLAAASTKAVKESGNKVEQAKAIGRQLAEAAVANKVSSVVFDRNGYLYHGRVKALADGAREGGLQF
ncbi:MAG: 50S ribosomal protein L18 [Bacteroidota bacterium]|nr:50S ribosomal protein L18 [Bacteroidota bacterium]